MFRMYAQFILSAFVVILSTSALRAEEYDAVKLNKELIGNPLIADGYKGKTIEVVGTYYGAKPVPNTAAYLATFQNYAGIGECLHIRCIFANKAALMNMKPGAPFKVQGKVVSVVQDIIVIEVK